MMGPKYIAVLVCSAALFECVGDSSTPTPDASNDATSDVAQGTDANDAASDASDASATVYNDFTDASSWSTFDTTGVSTNLKGYEGVAFDGRYLYFVPNFNTSAVDGVVLRYDTTANFNSASSWLTFDTTAVNANAKGFAGGAFDGRYVYLVPNSSDGTNPDGVIVRYDTKASFTVAGSWTGFDLTQVNVSLTGFWGATFDGQYLYLVPDYNGVRDGIVAQYNTKMTFNSVGSWSLFDTTTVDANAKGFYGAVFDGRYVYLVPHNNNNVFDGVVAQYDTEASFNTAASWHTFDTSTVNTNAVGFAGGVFDGRYVYFVPDGTGVAARYDTKAAFGVSGSWSAFDVSTLDSNAVGFSSGAFDGRYVYFVPNNGGATGLMPRYDTTGSFTASASWKTFNVGSLNGTAKGFGGGAFDGQYLYLAPFYGTVVARLNAKAPPSQPALPSYFGSFF